jgi:ABC-type transport system involved in multi-copper enzyme maturation permease subunit
MLRPALTIARYTLLEAVRNRLGWVLAVVVMAAAGIGGFLGELALTESGELQAALLAAALRLFAVFMVATCVAASTVRETNDKGAEMLLALPMPRAAYLLGKLLGFCLLALLPALVFGALALCFAPAGQAALWSASLLCELWIVAAFSLLCALSFSHVLPALAATGGFYVLARSAASLQLLGHAQGGVPSFGQQAIRAGVDGLAALLPRLDGFTRTDWIVYHDGAAADLPPLLAQTVIYVALLAAAALFDLYRKEL